MNKVDGMKIDFALFGIKRQYRKPVICKCGHKCPSTGYYRLHKRICKLNEVKYDNTTND